MKNPRFLGRRAAALVIALFFASTSFAALPTGNTAENDIQQVTVLPACATAPGETEDGSIENPICDPTLNATCDPTLNATCDPTIDPTCIAIYPPTDVPIDVPIDVPTDDSTDISQEKINSLLISPTSVVKFDNGATVVCSPEVPAGQDGEWTTYQVSPETQICPYTVPVTMTVPIPVEDGGDSGGVAVLPCGDSGATDECVLTEQSNALLTAVEEEYVIGEPQVEMSLGDDGVVTTQDQLHTVTFAVNPGDRGAITGNATESVADGQSIAQIPAVTADLYYAFDAWVDQDGKEYASDQAIKDLPIAGDMTFTARFKSLRSASDHFTFHVTLKAINGSFDENAVTQFDVEEWMMSEMAPLSNLSDGATFVEPTVTPDAGMTFWYWLDENGQKVDDLKSHAIQEDMTFYAYCDVDSDGDGLPDGVQNGGSVVPALPTTHRYVVTLALKGDGAFNGGRAVFLVKVVDGQNATLGQAQGGFNAPTPMPTNPTASVFFAWEDGAGNAIADLAQYVVSKDETIWARFEADLDSDGVADCSQTPGGCGTTDPGTTDPGTTDPGTTDPGTTDPGTTDPGTTDPGTTDPGTTDPGTTDPGTTDPGTTDPGTTDPGTTDPGTTDPGTTDPGTTDPGTTDPGTTDPGTTDPGTTDPGTTDPDDTVTEFPEDDGEDTVVDNPDQGTNDPDTDVEVPAMETIDIQYTVGANGSLDGTTSYQGVLVSEKLAERAPAPLPTPHYGYVFNGWMDASGNAVDPATATATAAMTTIEAQFVLDQAKPDENGDGIPDDQQNRYTVTFVAGQNGALNGTLNYVFIGGTKGDGKALTLKNIVGNTFAVPKAVADSGYAFAGWSPSTSLKDLKLNGDMTFTANFKAQKVECTFTCNGRTIKSCLGQKGSSIGSISGGAKSIQVPKSPGNQYNFLGWLCPDGIIRSTEDTMKLKINAETVFQACFAKR